MIRKVVVPAAGLGTRLLTVTKEMPKEMLPIFVKGKDGGRRQVKPMLEVIFNQLYDAGFREFCFIIGRGKRAIEDHFNKDSNFISYLKGKQKNDHAIELEEFYRKVESSNIIFINQPEPKGFGDAIYRANPFTLDNNFMVHAGDDLVISNDMSHVKRLIKVFEEKGADAALLAERLDDPRRYGVITGVEVDTGVYKVADIVEKPEVPPSNLATIAIYVFNNKIYRALEETQPDKSGEVQLTDAIKRLITIGGQVYAVKLYPDEKRIDVGTPESYWNALKETFNAR